MNKFALIGYPLSHSLSAVIHNAAFIDTNIESSSYEILETQPEDLVSRIKYLKTNNYKGFNITIPLKVPVTMFLDEVDENANIAGCVNTVKIMPDKSLYGYNTDIYGFKSAIPKDIQLSLQNQKATILGTGGAARACAIGLIQLGITEIDFFARNIINANSMVNFLREIFPHCKMNLFQFETLKNVSDSIIIVNTTPIGMKSKAMNESILAIEHLKSLPNNAIVYDIVYNPIKTKLLQLAQEQNLKIIMGLDMLIYQAINAFEIWNEQTPSFDKMKIAALEALLMQ